MMVFTPVLTKMGLTFGVYPLLVIMLIYYAAFTAFCTPAASSNAALIFGNTEWIHSRQAYFLGFCILVVAIIVLVGIGIPLGQIML